MARHAFTVDVEEWFHICGVDDRLPTAAWPTLESRVAATTTALLEDLSSTGRRATFFVVGWVATRFPELVAQIHAAGHEVGLHSYWHRRVYELDPETFREDLRENDAAIRAAGVTPVPAFRAPEWSLTSRAPWALGVLAQEGIRIDASRAPVARVGSPRHPRRPYPIATEAGPLLEVPPLVGQLAGQAVPLGWGWGLRQAAPRDVLAALDDHERRGDPAVLMVHPWEIDPEPPRVRLPAPLAFAHYYRLSGFRARLREILAHADVGAIGDLEDAAGWIRA